MARPLLEESVAVTKRRCHRRGGTSVVEALAAITLLGVGVLAIAATGAASLRLETSANRRAHAASSVSTRFELLHRAGCASSAGADSALGVSAVWRSIGVDSVQQSVDSVVIVDRLSAHPITEVIKSAAPCR